MNPKYKKDFLKAGQLAREVRAYGKSLIVKGALYSEIIRKIKAKIVELNGIAAFPPQIALNDVAAHFLPQIGEEIVLSDQVVKLDIGVCCNGAIGDCAVTVDLSGKHQVLIDAAEGALLAAEKSVQVGMNISDIGRIIEETISSFGLKPVRNLSGHGLGLFQIHTPPIIPNYFYPMPGKIQPGMTFAIEPFATDGNGMIYEEGRPMIFSLVRQPKENSKVIYKIKSFSGLPFALHDLIGGEITAEEAQAAVKTLLNNGTISGYAPLVEEGHGMVAQAENSILIDEKGEVFVTTR